MSVVKLLRESQERHHLDATVRLLDQLVIRGAPKSAVASGNHDSLPEVPLIIDAMQGLPRASFQLAEVPGVGLGVFARQCIPAGVVVVQYTGRAMRRVPATSSSQYIVPVPRPTNYFIDAANEHRDATLHPFIIPGFAPDNPLRVLSVQEQQSGWARYMNSIGGLLPGKTQNVEYVEGSSVPPHTSSFPGVRRPFLPGRVYGVTTRLIATGEQLLVDYGAAFFIVDTNQVRVLDAHHLPVGEVRHAMARVLGVRSSEFVHTPVALTTLLPNVYEQALTGLSYSVRLLLDEAQGDVVAFLVALQPGRIIVMVQVVPQLQNAHDLRDILLQDAADAMRGLHATTEPRMLQVSLKHAQAVFGGKSLQEAVRNGKYSGFTLYRSKVGRGYIGLTRATLGIAWLSMHGVSDAAGVSKWAVHMLREARPDLPERVAVPSSDYRIVVVTERITARRLAVALTSADGQTVHMMHVPAGVVYNATRVPLLYWDVVQLAESLTPPITAIYADRLSVLEQTLRAAGYKVRGGHENVLGFRKFVRQ